LPTDTPLAVPLLSLTRPALIVSDLPLYALPTVTRAPSAEAPVRVFTVRPAASFA